jgi:acyl-CoA synthetase (AMP-forming)/AMP-acid ligase II
LGTVISIIDPEMGRENYKIKLKQLAPAAAFVDSRLILLNEHPIAKFLILKLNKFVPEFPRIKNCKLYASGIWLPILQKHSKISSIIKKQSSDSVSIIKSNAKDDFLITYTSGTLSEPKGVVHSCESLSNSLKHLADLLKSNNDAIIATHLPHYALLGINAGIKVHLWNNKVSAAEKINFIEKNKITTMFGPPSEWSPIIEFCNKNDIKLPESLRNIYLGSAPVYSSFLLKLIPIAHKINITCLYGMTENLMVCKQDGREKALETGDGDLVGTPFMGIKLKIAEDDEVFLHSNQLFSGYFLAEKSPEFHATGDFGKIDEKGRLVLLGRKKDMIIRGNFNIYPGLYEPTVNKIKGINEAVFIGKYNHQKNDEDIILIIDSEYNLNKETIINQLKSGEFSIDKEAWPDDIVFMKLPRSGRQQKVNRKLLRELV